MDATAKGSATTSAGDWACPYVNRADHRCSTRFSLGKIDQTFSMCFGAFQGCPQYHRIHAEEHTPDDGVVKALAGTPATPATPNRGPSEPGPADTFRPCRRTVRSRRCVVSFSRT